MIALRGATKTVVAANPSAPRHAQIHVNNCNQELNMNENIWLWDRPTWRWALLLFKIQLNSICIYLESVSVLLVVCCDFGLHNLNSTKNLVFSELEKLKFALPEDTICIFSPICRIQRKMQRTLHCLLCYIEKQTGGDAENMWRKSTPWPTF